MGQAEPAAGIDDVATAVHARHVVVIGGGAAGLVAAFECAKVGLAVTLLEESDQVGGSIRSIDVDGVVIDAAVEGWRARGGGVRALAVELGLEQKIVPARSGEVRIAGLASGSAPLPVDNVAGIPANAWDERVRRIIGWRGTWRAYLDRLRPPLTLGKERSLGVLVRSRMGEAVLERMVAPLSVGVYGIHPDDLDVEAIAPGLSTALTRTGSLGAAVSERLVDGDGGPDVEGLDGGTVVLVEALAARLRELGVDVRTRTAARSLRRVEPDRWEVVISEPEPEPEPEHDPEHDPEHEPDPELDPERDPERDPELDHPGPDAATPAPTALRADAVLVAVPESEARRLLAPVVPPLDAPLAPPGVLEVVTLVVREPALEAGEPVHAVHPVAGAHRAVAVTDSTVRWPWLAAALPGLHVLRITFGSRATPAATAGLDDAAAIEIAREEASALLGVPVADVRGAARQRFTPPQPASLRGHAAASTAARAAVRAVSGLGITGAWISGSGLAQVIPDAIDEAERLRRTLLFGAPSA